MFSLLGWVHARPRAIVDRDPGFTSLPSTRIGLQIIARFTLDGIAGGVTRGSDLCGIDKHRPRLVLDAVRSSDDDLVLLASQVCQELVEQLQLVAATIKPALLIHSHVIIGVSDIHAAQITLVISLRAQKEAVQPVQCPKPSSRQLQSRPHLSKDLNRLADIRLALSTQPRDDVRGIGLRAHTPFLVHVAEMRSIDAHKRSVVDRKSNQRRLHQDSAIVTHANELCHLMRRSKGFSGAVSPESFGNAVLIRWECWLVDGA